MIFLLTAAVIAASPLDGAIAFSMPPIKAPGAWVDLSALNQRPAGELGPVTVQGGHFVDGAGQRIRFLGTNLTFETAFPDHATATIMAERMAQLGMNVVRLHHLDNRVAPGGLWADAQQSALDPQQMDRLDWLIAELKRVGIYVNLNLHVSRSYAGYDWQGLPTTFNYGKTIDHFHPGMIEAQHQYARDMLGHRNPYTATTYAAEPAIAFVELNNENSLTGQANNVQLAELPEAFLAPLRQGWAAYLQAKYGGPEQAQAAWTAGIEPLGAEVLTNRDFSGGTNRWSLELPAPAQGAWSVVPRAAGGQALRAEMTQLGAESWHFQIHQTGLDLAEGRYYTVSFDARANEDRPVTVGARLDQADWHFLGPDLRTTFRSEWQRYTHTFRATRVEPNHSRLSFTLGNRLGWVELANVSLRPGMDTRLPAGATLDTMPLPVNAPLPAQAVDWLAFIDQTERRYVTDLRDEVDRLTDDRKLVIHTQASYGGTLGLAREADLFDFVDMHAYWQHPHFPGRPWDGADWRIPNTPLVAESSGGALWSLASYRAAGLPFTVSEYDHPAPSLYTSEMMPLFAAVAGRQDWDALYQFDYGNTAGQAEPRQSGYFQMLVNPTKVAFMPAAAVLFRGEAMPAAPSQALLALPRALAAQGGSINNQWAAVGVTGAAALASARLAVALTPAGDTATVQQTQGVADGAFRWLPAPADQACALIDTPQVAAVTGRIGGRTVTAGPLTVALAPTTRNFATVALTALDGQPLATSARMLLAIVGATGNTGMEWDDALTTVGNKWGRAPTVVEPLSAQLTLALGDRPLRVRILDGNAVPGAVVQTERAGDRTSVTVTPQHGTIWYAIDIP